MSQIASLARKSRTSSPTWARHGLTLPQTRNSVGKGLFLPSSPALELTKIAVARIGPEKGVIHIATGAVGNAIWDMFARSRSKPLWKLIVDMTPVRPSLLILVVNSYQIIGRVSPFDNFPIHHRCRHPRRSLEVVKGERGWEG